MTNTKPAPCQICGTVVPAGHLRVSLIYPNICHTCDRGNCVTCEEITCEEIKAAKDGTK